jgi:hypothetical protein
VINRVQHVNREVQTEIRASEINALQDLVINNRRDRQQVDKKLAENRVCSLN